MKAIIMFNKWIENTYRNKVSLHQEIYNKVITNKLSEKDLEIMLQITDAVRSKSEEE